MKKNEMYGRKYWDSLSLFTLKGCPEWARWAGADLNGYAHWFEYKPVRDLNRNWKVVEGRSKRIPGRFKGYGEAEDIEDMWQWILGKRDPETFTNRQPFTPSVFKIKARPSWAKYAFMTKKGLVFWAENKPTERTETEWVSPEGRTECLGYFNPENWNHVMSLEFGKLPDPMPKRMGKATKLTQEVFKRKGVPYHARYAAVDKDGTAHYFCGAPMLGYAQYPVCHKDVKNSVRWEDPYVSDFERPVIEGKFDASDWVNSVIRRKIFPLGTPPELTKKVFDHPDCPKWAKYAAVDGGGIAHWYKEQPKLHECKNIWVNGGFSERIPGEFDPCLFYSNTVYDWCECMIDREGNYIEPIYDHTRRLTKDIFKCYGCSDEIKYAAVNMSGIARFFYDRPHVKYDRSGWGYWTSSKSGLELPGRFSPVEWDSSIVCREYINKDATPMKLTHDVFDRPDCPKWSKYAAVQKIGIAEWFEEMPNRLETFWIARDKSNLFTRDRSKEKIIPGKFDATDWETSLIYKYDNKEKEKIMYRDSKGRFAKKATPKYYNNRDAKGRFTRHMLKEMVNSCKECWEPEPVIKEEGLTAEDYIARGIDMIMDEMGYAVNDAKAHNVTITITVDGKDLDLI